MTALPFGRLVHADWSKRPEGRRFAMATREGAGWSADGPFRVGDLPGFVTGLFAPTAGGGTLAGFDFPIGLPIAYARRTGLADFGAALAALGQGPWSRFFEVAAEPDEIGLGRPFFPDRPGGRSQKDLLNGHGVASMDALTRRCERGGPGRKAAGSLFWTLGANQVGKAALHGWRHVIQPSRERGAALWPFDGTLAGLARRGGLVLCETYPADVYDYVGASLRGQSKRNREHRRLKGPALQAWAARTKVRLTAALAETIDAGFGAAEGSDDGFDAVVGLFGLIGVASGHRPHGAPPDDAISRWEGWILGRQA